jgi:transcriptional antiterminator RfaH
MKRWYVVNTQGQKEARAQMNLRRQGFEAWLPQFRRRRRHARRVDSVLAPLFPSYLFVRLDPEIDRWRSINGTFGVVRLLCNGNTTPLAVPDGLVEEIMRRCDESGAVVLPRRRLAVGEAVRVAFGPFADLEGLFQEMSGRDRVVLLFDMLGRKVRASVPVVGLAA